LALQAESLGGVDPEEQQGRQGPCSWRSQASADGVATAPEVEVNIKAMDEPAGRSQERRRGSGVERPVRKN
jgi:hypothetical protein